MVVNPDRVSRWIYSVPINVTCKRKALEYREMINCDFTINVVIVFHCVGILYICVFKIVTMYMYHVWYDGLPIQYSVSTNPNPFVYSGQVLPKSTDPLCLF